MKGSSWYFYDDEKVYSMSFNEMAKTVEGTCSVLIYEREDCRYLNILEIYFLVYLGDNYFHSKVYRQFQWILNFKDNHF